MSPRLAAARTRVPQLAEAATVRARLAIVPARATTARRTPFVVLLFALLAGGVIGLLMFNTNMQQDAFKASALKSTATDLAAEQQGLNIELQHLRDPQRVAAAARDLGMVMPANPAFLRLRDGRVIGEAVPANADGALFVRNFPAVKPKALNPPPRIVKVIAPRRASTDTTTPAGMKKPSTNRNHSTAGNRG